MELKGKVIALLQLQTGTSAKGTWKKQEFILEIPGQHPKKVAISLWGDKTDNCPRVGELVSVSIDVESREHNSRWYTEVRAWKIERTDRSPEDQRAQSGQGIATQQPTNSGFASAPSADVSTDDLPF